MKNIEYKYRKKKTKNAYTFFKKEKNNTIIDYKQSFKKHRKW